MPNLMAQDSLSSELNKTYSAIDLKSDLHFIRQKAEFKNYRNNGFLFCGKKRFNQLADSIQQVIGEKKEMTVKDFYLLTQPLVSLLEDEDSYYGLKGDYAYQKGETKKFAEKIVVPLNTFIYNDTVRTFDSPEIPLHAQLLTIEGIPVIDMAKRINFMLFSDTKRYYPKSSIMRFSLYWHYPEIYALYNFTDSVLVSYIPIGAEDPVNKYIQLAQPGDTYYTDRIGPMLTRLDLFHLYFLDNTAVLRIDRQRSSDFSLDSLNAIFTRIKNQNAKNLVIDLSSCSYSTRTLWTAILPYLYDGEAELFTFHDGPDDVMKYAKKKTRKSKSVSGTYSRKMDDIRFKGDIYLYFHTGTQELAVNFADILIHNKVAKATYGQETGTRPDQYIYSTKYYLPVTGLCLYLSTTLMRSLDGELHREGIKPDFTLPWHPLEVRTENYYRHNRLYIQEVVNHINNNTFSYENSSD